MDGKLVNTELVQLVKLIMLLTCRERERELQILSDETICFYI